MLGKGCSYDYGHGGKGCMKLFGRNNLAYVKQLLISQAVQVANTGHLMVLKHVLALGYMLVHLPAIMTSD